MNIFKLLTPLIYWMLIISWTYILIFYIKKYKSIISKNIIRTLILILMIDSLRTLIESSYFGAWYTSLSGLLPISVYDFLAQPQIVFFPKILNLIVALIIILILLRRWLPQEAAKMLELQEKVSIQGKTINLTKSELLATQNRLQIAINNTRIGIWDLNPDDDKILCSEEFFTLLKYDSTQKTIDIKDFIALIHHEYQKKIEVSINSCKENEQLSFEEDILMITQHGEYKWIQISGKCIPQYNNDYSERVVGTCLDIDGRKKSESRIQKSLQEKEVLLGEVHHRVKNNLAILSSFLELKAINSDDKTIQILKETRGRIHAMALIHNQLYDNHDYSRISLQNYIPRLIEDVLKMYNHLPLKVESIIEIDDIIFDFNTLITLGLIINEIITNSLKHAFTETLNPQIIASASLTDEKNIVINLSDNGVGLKRGSISANTQTIGLVLIERMVKQLHGSVSVENTNGTFYAITLPPQKDLNE